MAVTRDDLGEIQVDFVWGNLPMQPDEDRGEAQLVPELDNHIIAVTQYNGFPGYDPETPFLDTVPNVEVPDLEGLDEAEATTALEEVNLNLGTSTTTPLGATVSNDGEVKSQSPIAGRTVNEGTNVNIVTYAAPIVPDLSGLTQSAANTALVNASLILGDVTTTDVGATVENNNTVESQDPVADTMVDTDTTVDIVLYAAPSVPDLGGMTEVEADDALTGVNLILGDVTTTFEDATVENDATVASQDPAADTTVDTGSSVDIVLYEAPTVPDVVGDDQPTAEAAIVASHLTVGTVSPTTDGATVENDGTVKSQDPVADTLVDTGSAVDLELYAAPVVPDLAGMTESEAGDALTAVDLILGDVTTSGDGATAENDGTVKSQDPAASTVVDTGSAVDIVLYAYAP